MDIYISYFYNIRFFPKNMIPVSTAVFDPKWYHNNGSATHIFVDERGVYNGVRIPELSPMKVETHSCGPDCKQEKGTGNCDVLTEYRNYIYSLNFNDIYNHLKDLCSVMKKTKHTHLEHNICLMVHEKPDNPCSERGVLINWFRDNGIEVKEFSKNVGDK